MTLDKNIYYVDQELLELITSDFESISERGWYQLFKNKSDGSYWRLDNWDKYQERFFLKIDNVENWAEFNSKTMQIALLATTRGFSSEKCMWKDCSKPALKNLAYCERHAYENVGIRR